MASEKITAIVESVKTMTVLELKELVDTICEEFGVSAVAAAAPAAAGAAAPADSLRDSLICRYPPGLRRSNFGRRRTRSLPGASPGLALAAPRSEVTENRTGVAGVTGGDIGGLRKNGTQSNREKPEENREM